MNEITEDKQEDIREVFLWNLSFCIEFSEDEVQEMWKEILITEGVEYFEL